MTQTAKELLDIVKTVALALLIALVLRVLVFQPYTIPSESMEPGLLKGDYIVVSKWSYGWSRHSIPFSPPLPAGRIMGRAPERGDVVVFQLPRDISQTYIKRIIGLPGDRVQVRDGVVFVNGAAIPRKAIGRTEDPGDRGLIVSEFEERRANGRTYVTFERPGTNPADNTEIYVVPENMYFAMGDNRDNSLDSRFPREIGVGFIPADNLAGKAQFVMASWTNGASIFKPWTWFTRFDAARIGRPLN